MKHLKSFLYLFIIVLLLQFCKSSDPAPAKPVDVGTPEITDPGTPFGSATSVTIGSAGGTITSADGIVTLDIPVGALDADKEISIEPITNNAPLGLDGMAYRFSPDGQIFKKPAKLTFNYTPDLLDSTSAQLLWIVTQAKDGSWKALLKSSVDDNAQTMSGQISHFSDWAIGRFMDLSIDPQSPVVKINEGVILAVSGFSDIYYNKRPNPNPDEDDLAPLTPVKISEDGSFSLLTPSNLGGSSTFKNPKWNLAGEGKLIPNSFNSYSVTYKAPSQVPTSRNPVAVNLQMVRSLSNDAIPSTFRNVVLVSNILIFEHSLVVNFQGVTYNTDLNSRDFIAAPVVITPEGIAWGGSNKSVGFTFGRTLKSVGRHTHVCGSVADGVTAYFPSTDYTLEWFDDQGNLHCGPFTSRITSFGTKVGQQIAGTFSGSLFDAHGNAYPISGTFNLPRGN
jgi:hypothetical protein